MASAWLQAGPNEQTEAVADGVTHSTFEMELAQGPAELKSWWYDTDGNPLAGAYYLTAERSGA